MIEPFFLHWKVGAGCPVAVTEKETGLPGQTDWLAGWAVISGAEFTLSVAAAEVADPQEFETTQS
jgi:hypothetical protein